MTELRRTDFRDPDFCALAARLDAELRELYPACPDDPDGQDPYDADNRVGPEARIIVARRDGTPCGSGAFRPVAESPGTAEIKRVYVAPECRRLGVARELLRALEARAAEEGFSRLILATGVNQPGAIRLYRGEGYALTERYGPYRDDALAVCMEKRLEAPGGTAGHGRRAPVR